MSIVLVSERPNPIVRAGDGPGVLYNRDTSMPLYIGSDTSIVNGNYNSASILDPLSSLYVDGDVDIWACAPVGTTPDNAIAVDFIHSGRSQHYTSPTVLTEPLGNVTASLSGLNGILTSIGDTLTSIQQILQSGGTGTGGGGLTFRGQVATESDLPATGNNPGDMWQASDTGHFWAWNGTQWIDLGTLPPGPAGPAGPVGPAGQGFRVLGSVATSSDLPANASYGDAWYVISTGSLYVWNPVS